MIYILAAAAGAANPAQAGANAELRKSMGLVLPATIFVYLSGLLGTTLILMAARQTFPSWNKLGGAPWWAWTGGLLSIGATLAGAAFSQKLGSGVFTGMSITASLVTSMVLDHYGWVGYKVHPISLPRALGCGLMLAGLWLMAKF